MAKEDNLLYFLKFVNMGLALIRLLCMLGIALSAYALYVKKRFDQDNTYKATCDISDKISCTKAFSSGHGTLFLLPNSVWGILFYFLVFFCSYISLKLVFFLALLSVFGSVYLAYILYTKVKSYCLICTSIYAVNFLLLVLGTMGAF